MQTIVKDRCAICVGGGYNGPSVIDKQRGFYDVYLGRLDGVLLGCTI